MANPVELVRLFKNVSPRVAQTLLGVQKLERSVASAAKLSQTMGNSEIGKLLGGLAKVGENVAGKGGVISVTAQKAAKSSDATILRVVVKKGKEVAAKVAATISPKSTKVGGNIAGESFHYVNKVMTNVEKFEALAKKLGVSMQTAQSRMQLAAANGILAKDEAAMTDIILGKYVQTCEKNSAVKMFAPEAYHTKYDPVSMDEYFSRGVRRAFEQEPMPSYLRPRNPNSPYVKMAEESRRKCGVFYSDSPFAEDVLPAMYSERSKI